MITEWSKLDKGSERLILVGPLQQSPLLDPPGLKDVPQIAIDGGARSAVNPVLWAGDGDSGNAPEGIPAFTKYSQDITDFRFCLSGIRSWRWNALHLFGFLGGRRDHELACFGEIQAEMKARIPFSRAVFYGSDNLPQVQFFRAGKHSVELRGAFSLLVLETAVVTLSGDCRYKTTATALGSLTGQGISNEASGVVEISATGPFMLLGGL